MGRVERERPRQLSVGDWEVRSKLRFLKEGVATVEFATPCVAATQDFFTLCK